ncbi:MAG: nucleotidyltransferase family protein [Propionibacteriaceae bacterium]|nr:nucleotidyltransferase family protein [Propionibacteriaceae bacterium]
MTSDSPAVPLSVRVMLGHAAVQRVADLHAVDILHLKGFALDDTVSWAGRVGSDVDVLVRPDHVGRFLDALSASGWNLSIGFEAGSPFGHAATLLHDVWGYVDVHRLYPGITMSPAAAFDILWGERGESEIAGARCPVPSLAGQAVILVLHAARSEDKARGLRDVDAAWGGPPLSSGRASPNWSAAWVLKWRSPRRSATSTSSRIVPITTCGRSCRRGAPASRSGGPGSRRRPPWGTRSGWCCGRRWSTWSTWLWFWDGLPPAGRLCRSSSRGRCVGCGRSGACDTTLPGGRDEHPAAPAGGRGRRRVGRRGVRGPGPGRVHSGPAGFRGTDLGRGPPWGSPRPDRTGGGPGRDRSRRRPRRCRPVCRPAAGSGAARRGAQRARPQRPSVSAVMVATARSISSKTSSLTSSPRR